MFTVQWHPIFLLNWGTLLECGTLDSSALTAIALVRDGSVRSIEWETTG